MCMRNSGVNVRICRKFSYQKVVYVLHFYISLHCTCWLYFIAVGAEKEIKFSHKIIKSAANQYISHCDFVLVSEFKLKINPNSSNWFSPACTQSIIEAVHETDHIKPAYVGAATACVCAAEMQLVKAHWHWTQGLFMKGMDTIWLLINEWPFLMEIVSAHFVQKAADVESMWCTLLEGQDQVQEAQKPAKNLRLQLAANVSRLIFGSYHVMQIRDYTTCRFTNNNGNDTCSYKKF